MIVTYFNILFFLKTNLFTIVQLYSNKFFLDVSRDEYITCTDKMPQVTRYVIGP